MTPLMTDARPEPGRVPPVTYDDVTEYEPYPQVGTTDEQVLSDPSVPYESQYPHQDVQAARVLEHETTVPKASLAMARELGQFHGRLSRPGFWMGVLGHLGALLSLAVVFFTAIIVLGIGVGSGGLAAALAAIIAGLLGLAALVTGVSIAGAAVRRLHDAGLPGWALVAALVPTVGWIGLILMLCLPSQQRINRHGPYPAPR